MAVLEPRDKKIIQSLVREIRNATGYERTPTQVLDYLMDKNVKDLYRACRKILDDADLILSMASRMKLRDQDRIPSSVELNMG